MLFGNCSPVRDLILLLRIQIPVLTHIKGHSWGFPDDSGVNIPPANAGGQWSVDPWSGKITHVAEQSKPMHLNYWGTVFCQPGSCNYLVHLLNYWSPTRTTRTLTPQQELLEPSYPTASKASSMRSMRTTIREHHTTHKIQHSQKK